MGAARRRHGAAGCDYTTGLPPLGTVMNTSRLFLFFLLFTAALHSAAQERAETRDLQQAMSAEEFKAAGLDKLSAGELAALNAWLQRKVDHETAQVKEQAREEGRKEVVEKNRGFFDFGSSEPIVATLSGDFNGFGKGKQYVLDNGQVWQQMDSATLVGVRKSNPQVSIKPGIMGVWYLRVQGYNTATKVQRIK
jgi:hypothetical protein